MTYSETLTWMFEQLPMYQKQGKTAFNAKLDKIQQFSNHLKQPHKKFKSIHVAGTNGKGSSSHMLASILQEAGYKVGLYTSPHLKDFRERIRINGRPVSEKFVTEFIADNQSFFEAFKLSFFEMTVGMAFDRFAKENVDIAIIEVGLGGRLDSTNIITPEISLITNIGLDHTDMLGNTLAKIAYEKGGIIKTNVPVVISEFQEETAAVFRKIAHEMHAPLTFADQTTIEAYSTSLLGEYQKKNVKGVMVVLKLLTEFSVEKSHITLGLKNTVKNTGLLGRWQILNTQPMIVCDTAHNKEGLTLVVNQLHKQQFENLHIVLGFVKEKDLDSILALFPTNAHYYFCSPDISRGLPADVLKEKAFSFNLVGEDFESVKKALDAAIQAATLKDFVFVGGSNFVVAEVV